MTDASTEGGSNKKEKPLSKIDWVLLPVLSLVTIVAIVCSVETLARFLYTESNTTTIKCLVVNDPTTGVRAIPNTNCSQKIFESELTNYAINSCGHRAGIECGSKPYGTYRIVLVGSSFNYGMWVPREKSFAALLPVELSRRTGRRVELYNEAMQWGMPHSVDLRLNEVLAAKPDMILWPLTPTDIKSVDMTLPYVGPPGNDGKVIDTHGEAAGKILEGWRRVELAFTAKSPLEFIRDAWKRLVSTLDDTRSVFLLQHILFKSQSQYVRQYLMQSDASEYLQTEPTAAWVRNLAHFAGYFADVQAQADSIGATVVVVILPERAQAAMISMNEWPTGFDPYKLGDEVRSIVMSYGGTYIDILSGFRNIPNPERNYLPVDGHPYASGQALISDLLAEALTSGAVPALKVATGPQRARSTSP